jgi:plastocyanin
MQRRMTWVAVAGFVAVALTGASALVQPDQRGSIHGKVTVDGVPAGQTAVVYIEKAAGTFKPLSEAATMDQKGLKFVPHVLPILLGTTVRFLNSDQVPHSVFSPDHETYNLGTWPPGQAKTYTFSRDCKTFPCAYTQLCALHPDMEAFIVVLPNPYFARTDAQGAFLLDGVPAGTLRVGVWAASAKPTGEEVVVKAGASVSVNFALSGQ